MHFTQNRLASRRTSSNHLGQHQISKSRKRCVPKVCVGKGSPGSHPSLPSHTGLPFGCINQFAMAQTCDSAHPRHLGLRGSHRETPRTGANAGSADTLTHDARSNILKQDGRADMSDSQENVHWRSKLGDHRWWVAYQSHAATRTNRADPCFQNLSESTSRNLVK